MRCLFILSLLVFSTITSIAQEKYWIYFNSKTGNPTDLPSIELEKSQRDLPISPEYLHQLESIDVIPSVKSKWLNAITAIITRDQIDKMKSLPFIKAIKPTRHIASTHKYKNDQDLFAKYITALKQVKADLLIEEGLNGEGVDVGIIDGGFMGANAEPKLDDIFYEEQFKIYRDFTGMYPDPFEGQKIHQDDHGTRVWRNIGGFDRDKEEYFGVATYSNYYLAKTDRGNAEFRGEEDYWIAAIEWMDSLGIKIVNSSIGYSTDFDNPAEDYDPLEIDGQTSPITLAAQIAAQEKGILLVVSAGNDGNKEFQVLSVPADAKGVFTVGACTTGNTKKMSFSSIGSPYIQYVKPDACCYSLGGTSFSAPIITGMAAAMKQSNPGISNFEIMEIIRKSSHLYPYPNNYIGFGVPNGEKILKLLKSPELKVWQNIEMNIGGNLVSLDAESLKKVIVYHKKNEILVLEEQELSSKNDEFIITKPTGTKRTTVVINGKVFEIFWE